jgi:hypothetical protein
LVPPRIKATTLESQLIHLIQELSGRTLRAKCAPQAWKARGRRPDCQDPNKLAKKLAEKLDEEHDDE